METKLNSIKLAIQALNEHTDRLEQQMDRLTKNTCDCSDVISKYAEDLENCRIAIEDMKRLKEECEFEIAMDKFLYADKQPDDHVTDVVLDE